MARYIRQEWKRAEETRYHARPWNYYRTTLSLLLYLRIRKAISCRAGCAHNRSRASYICACMAQRAVRRMTMQIKAPRMYVYILFTRETSFTFDAVRRPACANDSRLLPARAHLNQWHLAVRGEYSACACARSAIIAAAARMDLPECTI